MAAAKKAPTSSKPKSATKPKSAAAAASKPKSAAAASRPKSATSKPKSRATAAARPASGRAPRPTAVQRKLDEREKQRQERREEIGRCLGPQTTAYMQKCHESGACHLYDLDKCGRFGMNEKTFPAFPTHVDDAQYMELVKRVGEGDERAGRKKVGEARKCARDEMWKDNGFLEGLSASCPEEYRRWYERQQQQQQPAMAAAGGGRRWMLRR